MREEQQDRKYNEDRTNLLQFSVGGLVLLTQPPHTVGVSTKLLPKATGPWIIEDLTEHTILVRHHATGAPGGREPFSGAALPVNKSRCIPFPLPLPYVSKNLSPCYEIALESMRNSIPGDIFCFDPNWGNDHISGTFALAVLVTNRFPALEARTLVSHSGVRDDLRSRKWIESYEIVVGANAVLVPSVLLKDARLEPASVDLIQDALESYLEGRQQRRPVGDL